MVFINSNSYWCAESWEKITAMPLTKFVRWNIKEVNVCKKVPQYRGQREICRYKDNEQNEIQEWLVADNEVQEFTDEK